jgi:hypothetical protein
MIPILFVFGGFVVCVFSFVVLCEHVYVRCMK